MESTEQKDFGHIELDPKPQDNLGVIQYGVGFDVHKHKIAVCVKAQIGTGELVEIKCLNFRGSKQGLKELMNFLRKYQPVSNYLMECTGVYHLPLYYALQDTFPDSTNKIIAMNPLLLNRRLTDLNSHNDRVDSIKLANLSFYRALLKPSYIGDLNFYHMRDYIRSYHKSKIQQTRLRARMIRNLDSANIKFDFDFSYEWALLLLDHFLSRDWNLYEAYMHLIKSLQRDNFPTKVLEKQIKDIIIEKDARVPENARKLLQTDLARFLYEDAVALSFLKEAERLVIRNDELFYYYKILIQLPGMASVSALTILLELGDFHRFQNWRALAKYCGVVPLGYESAETKWVGHINRFSNKSLRTTLYQVAGTLINRAKRENDLARFAHRQFHVRKLPYKKAAIKVAQKLARSLFSILVLKVPYDPDHEFKARKEAELKRRINRNNSLLESSRTRAARRQIQNFLVTNYDFINSTSRYHLKQGFTRLLNRMRYDDVIQTKTKKKDESF